jgi:hypothetical protein
VIAVFFIDVIKMSLRIYLMSHNNVVMGQCYLFEAILMPPLKRMLENTHRGVLAGYAHDCSVVFGDTIESYVNAQKMHARMKGGNA